MLGCRFLLGRDGEDLGDAPVLRLEQQPGEASHSEGFAAADSLDTEVASELGRSDADLEASVLDTLTDTVLTGARCILSVLGRTSACCAVCCSYHMPLLHSGQFIVNAPTRGGVAREHEGGKREGLLKPRTTTDHSHILVLAACTWSPEDARRRLVTVLDRGVARPPDRNLPGSAVGARFPQLCLRKYYVVCSRGGGSELPEGCLHEVRVHTVALELQLLTCTSYASLSPAGRQSCLALDAATS